MEAVLLAVAIIFLVLYIREIKKRRTVEVKVQTVNDLELYCSTRRGEADRIVNDAKAEFQRLTENIKIMKAEHKDLQTELMVLTEETRIKAVNIEAYDNLKSDEIKNQLQLLRNKQDEMIKIDRAIKITATFGTKKESENQKKQILRCFNAECSNITEAVTPKNIDACRSKIQRSFEALNKIFSTDGVQLSQDYLATKLEELSIVYAYAIKVEEEKEQQRAIREQMVEEEKVRREIEREKLKIEKEETQFKGEINKLMGYMQKATDEIEKKLYIDKIHELEDKLKLLEKDKENVLQREQNTRAGFVYIISNIGSFGENIYKIGMTRRLEPMDRIKELGDASVPFGFDVHALIFSEDAPALETILHQTFRTHQVNKVNPRKEFFNVDLDKVRGVVTANHNATVHFVDMPDAFEYRESLRLSGQEEMTAS